MQRTENLVTYEVCIVCVRALVREQSTVKRCLLFTVGASGSHIGNEEYNYKTLQQDVQWIYYIQTCSLYFSSCGARSGSPQIVVRVAVLRHTLWGSYSECAWCRIQV